LSKNDLLEKIESITSSTKPLDIYALSNARHYLNEVNDVLIDISSSLKSKEQAADNANKLLIDCHVDVKLLEKYESNKKSELSLEIEKLESREIEDNWLQNKHSSQQRENI